MKLHQRVLIGSLLLTACVSMSGCIVRAERVVYDPPTPAPHVPRTTTTTTTVVRSTGQPDYNSVPNYGRKHQFYYYPNAQVYRDCESNRWHWVKNNSWNVSVDLPKTIVLDVDGPVAIEIDADEPSGHHAIVSREHPGKGNRFGHRKDRDNDYDRDDDKDGKRKNKKRYKSASAEDDRRDRDDR